MVMIIIIMTIIRFDNVMIWVAPEWSPASVQYTHGFPRRMIEEEHGGFQPGNIILTTKANNLALRRMAICDVASLVSQVSVAGSGLAVGCLINLTQRKSVLLVLTSTIQACFSPKV